MTKTRKEVTTFAPRLPLTASDLKTMTRWYLETMGRKPSSDAEAVSAFVWSALHRDLYSVWESQMQADEEAANNV